MKEFELIVAMDLDGAIGNSETNNIPWHIPADLQHFKEKTLGKTIVMGSKTWASLPVKPLKGRRNVVISRNEIGFVGCDAQYSSLKEALEKEENVVIIGGGQIYHEAVNYGPQVLHLTIVWTESKGDIHCPYEGNNMLIFGSFRYCEHTYVQMRSADSMEGKLKFTTQEWHKLPIAKLSTDRYQFVAFETNGNVTVELEDTETGKKKIFTKVNGNLEGYINLMNSLTDELCESFFGGKKKKGKKNA